MDYRALSELVIMSLMGLSVLAVALGFSVRVFLAPVLRDILAKRSTEAEREQQLLSVRMERLEERLESIDGAVRRIAAVEEFNRALKGGDPPEEG